MALEPHLLQQTLAVIKLLEDEIEHLTDLDDIISLLAEEQVEHNRWSVLAKTVDVVRLWIELAACVYILSFAPNFIKNDMKAGGSLGGLPVVFFILLSCAYFIGRVRGRLTLNDISLPDDLKNDSLVIPHKNMDLFSFLGMIHIHSNRLENHVSRLRELLSDDSLEAYFLQKAIRSRLRISIEDLNLLTVSPAAPLPRRLSF